MSVPLYDFIEYKGKHPVDIRTEYATLEDMKGTYSTRQLASGMVAWVKSEQKHYMYNEANADDSVLGRWREYNPAKEYIDAKENYFGGYYYNGEFYTDSAHTEVMPKLANKIYLNFASAPEYIAYACDGVNYLRIGSQQSQIDAYTKAEADARFAPISHQHVADDIKSESYMGVDEMEEILNN